MYYVELRFPGVEDSTTVTEVLTRFMDSVTVHNLPIPEVIVEKALDDDFEGDYGPETKFEPTNKFDYLLPPEEE